MRPREIARWKRGRPQSLSHRGRDLGRIRGERRSRARVAPALRPSGAGPTRPSPEGGRAAAPLPRRGEAGPNDAPLPEHDALVRHLTTGAAALTRSVPAGGYT